MTRARSSRSLLVEELGPSSLGELLDIGTGSGLMLEVLGPRAGHAVGIDISAPALRLARTRIHGVGLSHCEFRRGDMYSLPVEDGTFDTGHAGSGADAGATARRGAAARRRARCGREGG